MYWESYVCTAGVRCGRWDLDMTSVQFPSYYRESQVGATQDEFPECMEIFHTLGELSPSGHVCCGVSPCGQELVRGEIRKFRYEMGGTWVFTVLLPCVGQFFAFSTRKSLLTHSVPWCKGGIRWKGMNKRYYNILVYNHKQIICIQALKWVHTRKKK